MKSNNWCLDGRGLQTDRDEPNSEHAALPVPLAQVAAPQESTMLKLEDIKKNAAVTGIVPGQVVRIVTTEPVGFDALTVYYKPADGQLQERMLFRADEVNLALAEAGRPWGFELEHRRFLWGGNLGQRHRQCGSRAVGLIVVGLEHPSRRGT